MIFLKIKTLSNQNSAPSSKLTTFSGFRQQITYSLFLGCYIAELPYTLKSNCWIPLENYEVYMEIIKSLTHFLLWTCQHGWRTNKMEPVAQELAFREECVTWVHNCNVHIRVPTRKWTSCNQFPGSGITAVGHKFNKNKTKPRDKAYCLIISALSQTMCSSEVFTPALNHIIKMGNMNYK